MSEQSPITPTQRHDGWTPARRTKFLDHLAGRGNVRAACAHAGMSAEAAYRLRRREAAFARAWAAALGLAREAGGDELATRAIDGVEEDVWYRGELVGTRRKYDARLLLAHLARLDKLVEETPAGEDIHRFDELVALAAGAAVPDELRGEDGGLPRQREEHCRFAVENADLAPIFQADEKADPPADEAEERARAEALDAACMEAVAAAERDAGIAWDAWFAGACSLVDSSLGQSAAGPADPAPRTSSVSSTSSLAAALLGPNAAALVARA